MEVGKEKYSDSKTSRTYLGTLCTRKPGNKEEILLRIMPGNQRKYALNRSLKSKHISGKSKIQIYNTVIPPMAAKHEQ